MQVIYVDSLHGSDLNTGEIFSPVASLSIALDKVDSGGTIVIAKGTGLSYGDLTITKNVSIVSRDSDTRVGTLRFINSQGLVRGVKFENLSNGIQVVGSNYGTLIVRECKFINVEDAIKTDYLNYVAIHRNFFFGCKIGISINTALEACISSNIFSGNYRSLTVSSIERIDFWRNTIYGAANVPYTVVPDYNLRIIYKTLTYMDIYYKRLQLPGRAAKAVDGKYDVAFNVINGTSFNYGIDFIVIGNGTIISWNGLGLENKFVVGDIVRIMYSEDEDIEAGEAIRLQNVGDSNSRIDSNSLSGTKVAGVETPIDTGVLSNTPVKIRYNNFDMVNRWWDGFIPTGDTGINNIGETALYIDPNNNDFRLRPSSPNINSSDPNRWNNILEEIGIIKVNGHYTASYTGIRENVAPFDNDIDYDGFYRGVTGITNIEGDIGALEYNVDEDSTGNYIGEFGYDKSYPGTETAPYFSIDRGFQRALDKLNAITNIVPIVEENTVLEVEDNIRYGKYYSKDLVLNEVFLNVGKKTKKDIITIYQEYNTIDLSNYKCVSMNGNDEIGDGSLLFPYRTIQRAIQDNPKVIVVEPGTYPTFKGKDDIKIVSIEKLFEMESVKRYCEVSRQFWTGSNYRLLVDGAKLYNNSNIFSNFRIGINPDIKFSLLVRSNKLSVVLFNNDNKIFVTINRDVSSITYGYDTNGMLYNINYFVSSGISTSLELKIRFIVIQNKFSIIINGANVNISYSNFFQSGSLADWVLKCYNIGDGVDLIYNINIFSDSFVGITGINSLKMSKKVFSIIGETGLKDG